MQLRGEGTRGAVATAVRGGIEALAEVEEGWRGLCGASSWDEPFHRPEWIRAHLECFEPAARLHVVVARRGGRLVGILPLVEERARWKGLPYRRLRGAAGVHSCRFDLLLAEGEEEEAREAIWRHLASLPDWHAIEVRDVPLGGAMEGVLERARREGFAVGTWESMRSPFVTLPARGGFEALCEDLPAKFRANLRRRRKRLAERGAVRFRRWDRADEHFLRAFFELEAAGWKGRRGTAIAASEETRRFYSRVAGWAEGEGMFASYSLELEGRAVAAHFGLVHRGRYFLPKAAYDEALGACSPGQLLVEDVLADCAGRGLGEFDFLGPWMQWKADWTDQVRPHRWCFIYRPNPLGRALHAAKLRLGPWLARMRDGKGGGGRGGSRSIS